MIIPENLGSRIVMLVAFSVIDLRRFRAELAFIYRKVTGNLWHYRSGKEEEAMR